MKKALAFILTAVILSGLLVACGNTEGDEKTAGKNTDEKTEYVDVSAITQEEAAKLAAEIEYPATLLLFFLKAREERDHWTKEPRDF